jgi:ABC-type antimicrobial peptide transport system permease subunit
MISSQVKLPWNMVFNLALKSLKKRFVRSLITMISVILAMVFLMSIWVGSDIIEGLKALQDPEITALLMKNGVDPTATGISSKMLWLICLSLLVCSVGIVNAMLMSVTERFKEIGTMKCLGAMDGFIIKIFMVEAAIQGAAGTSLGIVLGLGLGIASGVATYGSVALTSLPFLGIVGSALISFIIGVGLCTVFAIYPAYVAASMQPIDAMRVEE